MLTIVVPGGELFNEETGEFITVKEHKLQLEHSLVSLSKWESKWHKSFLSARTEKTDEETMDYIKCMTITQNVDPNIYKLLNRQNIMDINNYIGDSMTATYFPEDKFGKGRSEPITAEVLYYWMIKLQIPVEFQKWHLNRLIALIRVCNIKDQPPKKMSQQEVMSRHAAINAARRKKK